MELPKKGTVYLTGNLGSFISFLVSRIKKKALIFYDTEEEALLLQEELRYFSGREVYLFPFFSDRVFEKDDEMKKIDFLYHLSREADFIGLFPYSGLNEPLMGIKGLNSFKEISFGETVFQEEMLAYLDEKGYENVSLVREPGMYAKRGSIIDVYPPSLDHPVRIEFLGDEILSIRTFNPSTQRSNKELERVTITPAKVKVTDATLLDYIEEEMVLVHRGVDHLLMKTEKEDRPEGQIDKARERLLSCLNIDISGIQEDGGLVIEAISNEDLRLQFENRKTEIFQLLSEKLKGEWREVDFLYIFATTMRQAERLLEIFKNYGISLPIVEKIDNIDKTKEWAITVGPIRRGFRTSKIIILTEEDIVGQKKRVVKKRWEGFDDFINSFKDLSIGDWVVHIDHGIGIFKGIVKLVVSGFTKDFISIEYQDGDKLYVPIEDLHLVQKYIGGEKFKPKIDKLGTQYWKHTKSRIKRQIEDIAKELIDIYAQRELAEGHAYPDEDELFREMESKFEYEETEGQAEAIESVLKDLKSRRPMDRLICGDVGFGKTEVAIRAAFKVVMDNKQVAVLVPTTVLAQQHYKTFTERFKEYPIAVEMLSRFRGREEQKKILEDLKKGKVDIIIGTHRILQKDVVFKDLGLLVIDEEHRFGVKHKEALKEMKKNIDVLTLSATPIPRTLYMATTGIRDLSIINTPPLDRLAIKTTVVKFKDEVIKEGIKRELERGGQVFFVHNFIHNIGVVHDHLKRLFPEAKIAVAHGKMEGHVLEKIMLDFIDRKYDILLSTNIIESGLDISNVNTIFINNAHRMGLAELYQLRGRVGRGKRQAYAYLLVPKNEELTRDAIRRLKIMEELTELGSGFHIANYDLEIRGAGNLLGREQSGNINLVGFELYCNMLEEAIRELKDLPQEKDDFIAEINIPIDAYIPDSYIEDNTQKLIVYKRLSKIREEEELKDMEEELKDRYGEIPKALKNLLSIISFKIFLTGLKVRRVEYSHKQLVFHLSDKTKIDTKRLLFLIKKGGVVTKVMPEGKIVVTTDCKGEELIVFSRKLLNEIISV
ncbi:MAG: transcription-repair coupling factor [Syntrophorhabdaceae bacterium]|nr:transcription-repair coupling factor [Syntrophorhabdaceae bacterium]